METELNHQHPIKQHHCKPVVRSVLIQSIQLGAEGLLLLTVGVLMY